MKKWIAIGILAVLVGGGALWYSKDKDTPTVAKAMSTAVQKGDLEVKVTGSGAVEAVHSEDQTASSNAEVDEVLVDKNELVEKGDDLITFTDGSDPITAPFDGTVTTLEAEAGDRVAMGDAVSHITDYKNLKTTISVDELDVNSIKKGQAVELTASAFEDKTFTGKVTSVAKEGTYENGVSSFDVTIHLDKPGDLKIGMSAEASILTASAEDVLYVPIEAVQTNGDEKYVNIQNSASNSEEGTTTKQTVEVGMNNDQFIEIKTGLEEGQLVSLPVSVSGDSSGNGESGQMRGGNGEGFPGGMMQRGEMPGGGQMPGNGAGRSGN
ncbi:efflux RND transporter periplasmic adaptor subunit [Bacillus massiliglaciei]|uniref:efflux RND transporter periplasmic adaptor subunit n=1 Tax=Bacillus massiliglaciei TaxID=1816693 RepID=UPI000AF9EF1A|nr:efflux RND transporter periplasmic adaptor subunit [Bacillus massiliglaciei]